MLGISAIWIGVSRKLHLLIKSDFNYLKKNYKPISETCYRRSGQGVKGF